MALDWSFAAAAAAVIVTPGPDFALVLRQVARGGRRLGYPTVAGLLTGGSTHATLSVLGGGAAFAAQPRLFTVLQWCGAALLCWLGGRSLAGAARSRRLRRAAAVAGPAAATAPTTEPAAPAPEPIAGPATAAVPGPPARSTRRAGYLQGLASNLLNPKVGLFLLAFLPQFVPPHRPVTAALAGLAAAYLALGAAWLFLVVEVSWRLYRGVPARRAGVAAGVEAATGVILIVIAVHLVMH
jgi:threonine/homoserine/homoserine lactone efflux protein